MNLLILGGLFVLALLAIGGAVWLSLGERQAVATAQAPSAAPAPAASAPATVPLPVEQSETVPVMSTAPAREKHHMISAPALMEDKTDHPFSILNGQFYEVAAELRALHRESQDIE